MFLDTWSLRPHHHGLHRLQAILDRNEGPTWCYSFRGAWRYSRGRGRPPPDPPPRPIQEVANDLAKAKPGSPERQKLVDEFARAATHAKPPANRVVLGKWEKPGEGGYIDQAKSAGGRWYEVDENAFKNNRG